MTPNTRLDNSNKRTIPASNLLHNWTRQSASLGCMTCVDRTHCGGLNVAASVFNCMDYCCRSPLTCDSVCPFSPQHFQNRIREINGFDLSTIASVPTLRKPNLPTVIPLIYHGSRRQHAPRVPAVALCLYQLYDRRTGEPRFSSREHLAAHFRIDPDAHVLLSGAGPDAAVENFWNKADHQLLANLTRLKIDCVTTPNFSLFTDSPRWDDLHSIKRIALTWEFLARAGLAAALHINARTDTDYLRWTEFIQKHPEITDVAFEFGTGAGHKGRSDWHICRLIRLAKDVSRPIGIVLRGKSAAPILSAAFSSIVVVETDSFTKTLRRQRAVRQDTGRLDWVANHTERKELLDDLLQHNITAVQVETQDRLAPISPPSLHSATANNRDDQTRQRSLLHEPSLI
jgi:hypothetical protein